MSGSEPGPPAESRPAVRPGRDAEPPEAPVGAGLHVDEALTPRSSRRRAVDAYAVVINSQRDRAIRDQNTNDDVVSARVLRDIRQRLSEDGAQVRADVGVHEGVHGAVEVERGPET